MSLFLVSILFFFTRLVQLMEMPIFLDEAIYLKMAQDIIANPLSPFVSLGHGHQPFHTWLLIVPVLLIPDPLMAGRLVSVLAGFGSLLGLWAVARFYSLKIGKWFVLLCYIFSPVFLLHDRLAIKDSFLACVAIWFFYFSLKWLQDFSWRWMGPAAFTLGLGLLTKSIAFLFILLLPFSLFSISWQQRWNLKKLFPQVLVFALIAFGMQSIMRLSEGYNNILPHSASFILSWREFLETPFQLLKINGPDVFHWTVVYLGLPLLIVFGFSLIFLSVKHKRVLFLLSAWIFIPLGAEILFVKELFPRYFLFSFLFVYLLIGFFLEQVFLWVQKRKGRWLNFPVVLLGLLLLFLPLLASAKMLYDFPQAPLSPKDRWQYLESWPAGFGIKEAVLFFQKQPGPCIVLTEPWEVTSYALPFYLKKTSCKVQVLLPKEGPIDLQAIQPQFPDSNIFLVFNRRQQIPQGDIMKNVMSYPKVNKKEFLQIYRYEK